LYYDFLILAALGVLGLLAHLATRHRWLEWLLRGLIFTVALFEWLLYSLRPPEIVFNAWASAIFLFICIATPLVLIIIMRRLTSHLLTGADMVISGQVFLPLLPMFRKVSSVQNLVASCRIFVPKSIPHMVGLFLYISTAAYLLSSMDPISFQLPALPIPFPLTIGQLISYNGIGLVLLSFCGVGIFVTRKPRECLTRLGWVKPTWPQVGVGIMLIVFSFLYDYLWSVYTHSLMGQDLAGKLSSYNSGTFAVAGGFAPSVVLALATAICAGVGEETLVRGALQPVLGIVPAAILHGMLHGQFTHAPVFIVQVSLWSVFMGIVRRYTNTTTTIIGHSGFNFVTTFLFAFNP
jgi:hypothetical protein